MSVSGIYAYIEYGKQSNFTTAVAAGAATRAFGMDQEITSIEIDETMFNVGDLYQQEIQKFAFGQLDGSLGVSWTVSNPWWADFIQAVDSPTGAGPYTHTFNPTKSVNAFTVEVGIDTTTDRVLQLQRLTAKEITISTAIGELVKAQGNFQFGATPTTAGTSLDASVATDDITTPYTMAMATIENPSATPLAEVQSVQLTMNPQIKMVYGPNSESATNAYKGQLLLTGKFTITVVDNTWWNNVRAKAEPSNNTLRIKCTNGLAGTSERTMQFTLTGLGLGKHSHPKIDPNTLVVEDIPFTARDLVIVGVNNTAVSP